MWKIKNGFLAKIAWHYLCQEGRKNAHFRAHYLFWPKTFLDQNSVNQEKLKEIVVSAEIAQNQKWHLSLKKVFFDMGEKVGFTNCVFEKLCFLKTLFLYCFQQNTAFQKQKRYVEKTENLWKILGCFWTWQNGVFGFVLGFNVIVVCFWCVWHSSRSVKNAVFPVFLAFVGWLLLVYFWVWKV